MLQNLKKKTTDLRDSRTASKESGFTIIEVMIVLVIAAVIILIVFLAVPALQRNSRNNQRKNDASRVLAAANEWRANNSNQMPAPTGDNPGPTNEISTLAGDLGYYDSLAIVARDTGGSGDSWTGTPSWVLPTQVVVVTSAECASATSKASGTGMIAVYQIETGGGTEAVCTG